MPVAVSDADFTAEVLKSDLPVLLDFWAPWCGPCRGLAPVLEEIAEEFKGRVKVCKMNVDENSRMPAQFNVRAIPTLVLLKDGKVLEQVTGALPKSNIISMITQAL